MFTPREFVDKWRQVRLTERAAAQSHFLDLCRLVGHPSPAEADPAGRSFAFEAGAAKLGGGDGYADVWKKDFFAWEYKGKHANLDAAYRQLLQYREALENPPLLVVSDMEVIVVHTNFNNTVKREVRITYDDLLTRAGLDQLSAVFFSPNDFKPGQTPKQVTEDAAARFARLADRLRGTRADAHQVAHFLIRLLFCLFAEDIGLLPRGLFSRLIDAARGRPDAFTAQLRQLFGAMSRGDWFGAEEVAHFDGGLFDDDFVLPLDADGLAILREVACLDWSSIEPAILGTLFERSLDPDKRSQLGAHYTSRDDILLVVEPVLMAPLRRQWADVQSEVLELAARRDAASGRRRGRLQQAIEDRLRTFARELAAVRVLDPACGSGNFLYVALRELLDLWRQVAAMFSTLGGSMLYPLEGEAPHPSQLFGIEINPYAQELAQTTVWIGYLQWLSENGYGQPTPPILKPVQTVYRMDAILDRDADGRPVEPEWPAADVIIGNPPFLGGNRIRKELGDEYVEQLFRLYRNRVPAFADLVCYWFEKTRAEIDSGRAKRAGLLATQGIRGGSNRKVLERIKGTGDIFWAQSDRDWILGGAHVHVSMVGFDNGSEARRELNGLTVSRIAADLSADVDLTGTRQLSENSDLCFMGPSAKAPFDVDEEVGRTLRAAPVNVNGRPNADVVRPVASAIDLVQQSRGLFTIDFGLLPYEQAVLYELPFEYVRSHVLPVRTKRRADFRGCWWQYARPRPEMRRALAGKARFIATPAVAKHRIFVWVAADVLCNQGTLVFARDDDYFFGVLHSRPHELWARRKGTQLREAESGARYTPTSTFETYPLPWPPGQEPWDDPRLQAIAEAARELVGQRERWLNPEGVSAAELAGRTLTNLYNRRPEWLVLAHEQLDRAVFAAYGWPWGLSDEEVLTRLLALNLERAAR